MANYYGNIVPIFELERLLDLSATLQTEPRILLIGEGTQAVGVTVSEPPVRVRLTPVETITGNLPLPPLIQPFVQACYKRDRVWVRLNIEALFRALGDRS